MDIIYFIIQFLLIAASIALSVYQSVRIFGRSLSVPQILSIGLLGMSPFPFLLFFDIEWATLAAPYLMGPPVYVLLRIFTGEKILRVLIMTVLATGLTYIYSVILTMSLIAISVAFGGV